MPKLKYFEPSEFRAWYPLISHKLLRLLDQFREDWGAPVIISSVSGSIGREGLNDTSQHNLTAWGEVRAIDVHPVGMDTPEARKRAVELARDLGFTGIGVYPDWNRPGLHLDVRDSAAAGSPAMWAGIDVNGTQTYVAIERGIYG